MKSIVCLVLIIISFGTYAQVFEEYYRDGNLKGTGPKHDYVYINLGVGSVKHPKSKVKKKMGVWTYFSKSGYMMRKESYLNDKKGSDLGVVADGKWEYYNSDEELVKEELYARGRMIGFQVHMDGVIIEDEMETRIHLVDTSKHEMIRIGEGEKIKKQAIYNNARLLRRDVFVGSELVYQEIIDTLLVQNDEENLVYNGSFEEYIMPPSRPGTMEYSLRDWWDGGPGKCDYYNRNALTELSGVPVNQMGYQEAYMGNAYLGFDTQSSDYLQSELKTTLQKDSIYCIKMYVSRADYSSGIAKSIGVYFGAEREKFKNTDIVTGDVKFSPSTGFSDSDEWMEVCRDYIAQGDEKYITIGAFTEPPISHYYIDYVSVLQIQFASECDCNIYNLFAEFPYEKWEQGLSLLMDFIDFSAETADLTPESKVEMDNLYYILKEHPTVKVKIKSHIFEMDNKAFADKLTQERANAIKKYIVGRGINDGRIEAKGEGWLDPISDNESDDGRSKNERIELIVISL
ncbi:MAG: hypothetical protein C0594_04105 [Marinilabiliales bacterium]|nr:MAG: hypothetical protein C0594_04105 [Marinilabiliales bacterium]